WLVVVADVVTADGHGEGESDDEPEQGQRRGEYDGEGLRSMLAPGFLSAAQRSAQLCTEPQHDQREQEYQPGVIGQCGHGLRAAPAPVVLFSRIIADQLQVRTCRRHAADGCQGTPGRGDAVSRSPYHASRVWIGNPSQGGVICTYYIWQSLARSRSP